MTPRPTLQTRWIPLARARLYVRDHHRHLPRVAGGVLALGCYDGDRLCGVAILGRPIARLGDTGERLDVTRCATDGTPNAASALYAAARRVAQSLGLLPPRTQTLPEESGASLRGAGYTQIGTTRGGTWKRAGRTSKAADTGPKIVWSA